MDYTDLYNFQTNVGVIVPSDDEVLAGVKQKFSEIFGEDLDLSAETPVGRLIEAFAVLIRTSLGITAQAANQFNPTISTGIYLDSIGTLFDLARITGTHTKVAVKCYMGSEITIPAGSQIQSSLTGDLFSIDADIVGEPIGADDLDDAFVKSRDGVNYVGYGTATANATGPISGNVGTITVVQNAVVGWYGVTNTQILRIGSDVETDADFRKRIGEARAIGVGFRSSLTSRLRRIDNVLSLCILENNNSDTAIVKGVPMQGHSIFVCAYTGSHVVPDSLKKSIAEAIVATKPAGTGIVGSIDRVEIEGAQLQTYTVNELGDLRYGTEVAFYTPAEVNVKATIKVFPSTYTGIDLETSIKNVIMSYVMAVDIGNVAYTTELASAILKEIAGIKILGIELGIVGGEEDESGDFGPDRVASYAFQKLVASADDIVIEVVE